MVSALRLFAATLCVACSLAANGHVASIGPDGHAVGYSMTTSSIKTALPKPNTLTSTLSTIIISSTENSIIDPQPTETASFSSVSGPPVETESPPAHAQSANVDSQYHQLASVQNELSEDHPASPQPTELHTPITESTETLPENNEAPNNRPASTQSTTDQPASQPFHDRPVKTNPIQNDTPPKIHPLTHVDPPIDANQNMGIWFINNNSATHHISADWAAQDRTQHPNTAILDFETSTLDPNTSLFIPALAGLSPKFLVGVSPNNHSALVGSNRDHDTAIEATFSGNGGWTYYDVDIERGFSSPVWCHGLGEKWESGQGCTVDLLAACPEKYRHYDWASGVYDQCRGTRDRENLHLRASHCPMAYVRWDDERTRVTQGKHGEFCFCFVSCFFLAVPSHSVFTIFFVRDVIFLTS
jgi:hypothetical protein